MNGYELSREWFDWCFENPEKISPIHSALYFFAIEHCNRLGWKEKFGFPTTMAKEALGIKSYNTYTKALCDLVDWGFLIMIEKSKNQHSSNIIALSNFNKASDKATIKALDKAMIKHDTKQHESNCSINKPLTNNNITNNEEKEFFSDDDDDLDRSIKLAFLKVEKNKEKNIAPKKESNISISESLKFESPEWLDNVAMQQRHMPIIIIQKIDEFLIFLKTQEKEHTSRKEFVSHFINWISKKAQINQNKDPAKKETFIAGRQTEETLNSNFQKFKSYAK